LHRIITRCIRAIPAAFDLRAAQYPWRLPSLRWADVICALANAQGDLLL
jgi:hypothetical protein